MVKLKELPGNELVQGSYACAGCGGILAVRMALKVLGPETVIVTTPSCLLGVTTFYPQLAFKVPCVNVTFPSTAAAISGVVAGLRRRGKSGVKVVGLAGDGGTVDIGLQALSGAIERGDNFIFICYDNEAYMNTGVQRSGSTPPGARTTTTPVGRAGRGEDRPKKDMLAIVAAHNIPYAATASIGYPQDYLTKVQKAMETEGPAYVQVLAPCPPGWGYSSHLTVKLARLAVQTGQWPLAEYEGGRLTVKEVANPRPLNEYLALQARFAHLLASK
ncbi:MAG: pyruvate ferredoxin oxidoreductase beta subunit [Moorella sp. (in: firmicutes)]|uniref:Pyruvate synthase subunit PorB n=1 Tax=Neomoorella thermoacetica TaxID=1525 RepID=A0A1J5NRQ8_NEOTH|nr:pyruvate ferredoxin oxidoreductase beta subunit [Moorella sp. (in: firmicutes)]OIQ60928.1 pyruvate synthase subunit PorB [Moorella thermoacetica]